MEQSLARASNRPGPNARTKKAAPAKAPLSAIRSLKRFRFFSETL